MLPLPTILRRREESFDMKRFNFMKNSEGGEPITVGRTGKKKLDLFPRIVCFLVAVVVWLFMVNMNDPNSTETMTLKLSVVGELVTADGSALTVVSMDKSEVTITVKGTNRDLKHFTKGDYRAIVDVSDIEKTGEITLPVQITTPANSSIKLESQDVINVTLSVDLLVEKEIPLSVMFDENSQRVEDYEYKVLVDVDGVEIDTLESIMIKIKGAKSVVDRITAATYTVKYGEQSNKYFSVVPTYVTDSAEEIDTSRVTCSDITVTVKVISENGEEIESSSTVSWGSTEQVGSTESVSEDTEG